MSEPVTDEDRERVRELHALGLGRNEIAREMNRGTRTVSVIAAALNLTFDRTRTEEATRARMADLAEKRAILAEALTDDALRLTQQMWQPTVIYNFGGKDNTYASRDVPEPPAADKRQLMTAAGVALDRSLRLVPVVDDAATDAARSMLGSLAEGIRRLAEAPGEDTTGEG